MLFERLLTAERDSLMHVNLKRVRSKLASLGFEKIRRETGTYKTYFARPSNVPELTEWLFIAFQGKALEYVLPYVAISPIRKGALVKGLVETRFLPEIDEDPKRGRIPVLDDEDSLQWEAKHIEAFPKELHHLLTDSTTSLLQNTADARKAVKLYFQKFTHESAGTDILEWYENQNLGEGKSLAREFSHAPGICNLSGAHWIYEIAVFILLSWSREIEGKTFEFKGPTPFAVLDREMVLRKELIVDEIIAREKFAT
jgi:hypothetical protein